MNKKIIKALKDPYYACELVLNKLGPYVSDENFIKWKYYLNFRKKLDLDNPQTYNEKLQWLKLYDHRKEYTQMVDKYEAKNIVANLIGDDYIIPTLGVYNTFNEIDFEKLPNQFVLKCTHNSGGIIICRNKAILDIDKAKKQMTNWLKKNPYWANREYPYKNVRPRIIAEKYMEDDNSNDNSLDDYKFYCCRGEVKCILVCTNRNINVKYFYFSPSWEFLRWDKKTGKTDEYKRIVPPKCLDEMLKVASRLSTGMKEVRVDLYSINDKVYFGEYTFFSNSGLDLDITEECDRILGSYIEL